MELGAETQAPLPDDWIVELRSALGIQGYYTRVILTQYLYTPSYATYIYQVDPYTPPPLTHTLSYPSLGWAP